MWCTIYDMETNYILILLATLAQFILGALWYSPLLFGKVWMHIMEATHFSKEELKKMQKSMTPFYGLQFFLTLFSTFALVNLVGMTSLGIYHLAFWIWISFVVPTQISGVIWGNTKKQFWLKQILVMTTYQFVGIMLASAILSM